MSSFCKAIRSRNGQTNRSQCVSFHTTLEVASQLLRLCCPHSGVASRSSGHNKKRNNFGSHHSNRERIQTYSETPNYVRKPGNSSTGRQITPSEL